MKWYVVEQNIADSYLIKNDKLCHMLYIESESQEEAEKIAENLGCYWDGKKNGIDYPFDRWNRPEELDIDIYNYETLSVGDFFSNRYEKYRKFKNHYGEVSVPIDEGDCIRFTVKFRNFESYVQYISDRFQILTVPEARIYYKDGTIKEIDGDRYDANLEVEVRNK